MHTAFPVLRSLWTVSMGLVSSPHSILKVGIGRLRWQRAVFHIQHSQSDHWGSLNVFGCRSDSPMHLPPFNG